MNPLQELVANRLAELDLSYRRAAAKSGGLVSHSTLNQIVLGRVTFENRQEEVLRGIALAIDVPLSQVLQAAGEPPKLPTEFRLPKKASRLTPKQRKVILSMLDALLEEDEKE